MNIVPQFTRRPADTVELSLPYPVSMNSLWMRGRKGMIKTPRYASWFITAGTELVSQRPGRIIGTYAADVLIQRKDRKRRDIDNFYKGLSDLFVEHGVIDDDSLCEDLRLRWSETVKGAWVSLRRVG